MYGCGMQETTYGDLRVVLTGGSDRKGGGSGPVVVLLHGFGAPGDDLVPLFRILDVSRDVRFAFPQAPLSPPEMASYGGRAWWPRDLERLQGRDRSNEVPQGLASARDKLIACLDALQADLGVGPERVILGGFSQGGMLSCDVALRAAPAFAGLALLSTALISQEQWRPRIAAYTHLPVFQSHGRQDPVLPFAGAQRLRDLFTEVGCNVDWVEFNGGHEIPMSVLTGLSAFIGRTL